MPLINMAADETIAVSKDISFGEVYQWLNEKRLSSDQYTYLGTHKGCDTFTFVNPNTAMLFKLTFGGS